MAMRAQFNIQFDDEDLFNNFITPYKEGRVLNCIAAKCLSAYYYNEEIRNLIEEVVEEPEDDNQPDIPLCDKIRNSLQNQDFLANELQRTIDNGTDNIENILHQTNDFTKESGVVKPTTTEYDSNILEVSSDTSKVDINSQESPQADINSQDSSQGSIDTANQLQDYEKQVETVKNYADSITKGIDILANGINKLAQCITVLESEKKQLQDENELMKLTNNSISHHAPHDTAVIFSAQYFLDFRNTLKKSIDSLDNVLSSAIPMENELL